MALEAERKTFGFLLGYGDMLLGGIDPDDAFTPIAEGGSHPAWILGHLTWADSRMAVGLGGESGIDLEAWTKLFAGGTPALTDASAYPAWSEIVDAWHDSHARCEAAAPSVTAEILAQPNNHPILGKPYPTFESFFGFLMTGHESIHLGQLSAWRRVHGMPPLF